MLRLCCITLVFPSFLFAADSHEDDRAATEKNKAAVHREGVPPLMSLYLPIPLGVPGVKDGSTGVFIPANYRVGPTVDMIVVLRGYDIQRPKTATSVREYWNSPQHPILKSFMFREEVNRSGKNVILVVPALGPFAEAGKLQEHGGIQSFLDRVLDGLWRNGPHAGRARRPTIRHLILAAHSGGGVPLRRLADIVGEDAVLKKSLKACWGFDSIYGVKAKDAEFWSGWAKAHPHTSIAMFYRFTEKGTGTSRTLTGTTFPAMELERLAKAEKLRNVVVVREPTTVSHNEVPRTHLAELLKAAPYLDGR